MMTDGKSRSDQPRRWLRILALASVFVAALGIRLLYFVNASNALYGVEQERYRIAHFYHQASADLADGDDRVLFPRDVVPENTLLAGYPPGYFAVMGAVYRLTGNSMAAVLMLQCVGDALCCVVLVLLGEILFSTWAGFIAGMLMAISPQFAYLSLVLKPDTMTVLPVLLGLLLAVRASRSRGMAEWLFAGLMIGIACWLRQNALLLAPVVAVAVLVWTDWRRNLRGALAFVGTCMCVVAPLTVRNYVIYSEPVPVTTGSGFALLSGLARDDFENRYGLSRFAYNFSIEEAESNDLPTEYYFDEYDRLQASHRRKFEVKHTVLSVFAVDGIERDRARARKAVELIESDPGYYALICCKRVGRLMGYTAQNRPVPQEIASGAHRFESLEFHTAVDPRFGRWRYYAERGNPTDFLRPAIAVVQRLFVTPLLLMLAAAGCSILVARDWRTAILLLAIPVYYIGLQSLMWAEFRHTLPVHASVFLFIAYATMTGARLPGSIVRWAKGAQDVSDERN